MGLYPVRYGLNIVETWPWASVLAWRPRADVLPLAAA
jgi:hypothetical protein